MSIINEQETLKEKDKRDKTKGGSFVILLLTVSVDLADLRVSVR